MKLTDWVTNFATKSVDEITQYRNPKITLTQGNMFNEQYLTAMYRELDIMAIQIDVYRQSLLQTQDKTTNSTNDCAGVTNQDIIWLLYQDEDFYSMIQAYDVLTWEKFEEKFLDEACRKWVGCMWGRFRTQYDNSSTIPKRPVCSDQLTSDYLSIYNLQRELINFDVAWQYNEIFYDGSWGNSPFDLALDMFHNQKINNLKVMKPNDITEVNNIVQTKNGSVTYLPNELIVATQQLLQALDIDTTIDPRSDDEIAWLINQAGVVNWSVLLATGSIYNICSETGWVIDPDLLIQLQLTQQTLSQQVRSLDTQWWLNDVINGSTSSAQLAPQTSKLSALDPPARKEDSLYTPDYTTNPLGNVLDQISEDDLWAWGGGWLNPWSKLPDNLDAIIGAKEGKSMETVKLKQCVSNCKQEYNLKSACVETCTAKNGPWWVLSARACQQQCQNAKIACEAACLCDTTAVASQADTRKIHEMFELRRCVIPTNKLRGSRDDTCIRRDPDTWVLRWPDLQCLLDKTIDATTYARESGKWGIRVNPKERLELPNKFDLPKMIRFPVLFIGSPITKDPNKQKDIKTSFKKQQYPTLLSQPTSVTNLQVIGQTDTLMRSYLNEQMKKTQEINDTAVKTTKAIDK